MILALMAIFSIIFIQKENVSSERKTFSMKQELDTMKESYGSIERSMHTLSDVSLRRALIASMNSMLISNDSFFKDGQMAPDVLKQLMWNGTLPSDQSEVDFMENSTLEYNIGLLEDFYAQEPKRYNVTIDVDYQNLTIGIYDSFSIFFNTTFEVNISKTGLANLSRRIPVFEKVSVAGFEDPLYLINVTGGKDSRAINKSSIMENFTEEISLSVDEGNGSCYGELTGDISASDKDKKIFFNETIYSGADSFCGVIYETGATPGTSYLKVASVSSLSSLEGENLLLFGDADDWGIDEGLYNTTNFIGFAESGTYVSSDEAPSFFDMLEGSSACTYCAAYGTVGLETILDKNILSAPELHIDVDLEASNTLHEYITGAPEESFGLNESSVSPAFYEFRMGDSLVKYFE